MSKEWYSVNEVADILGETYKKIYNLLVAGELGHYRVGRSYRIRKTDLDAYFAKQAKQLHSSAGLPVEATAAVIVDMAELAAVAVPEPSTRQARDLAPATASASPHFHESGRASQESGTQRFFASETAVRGGLPMTTPEQPLPSRHARQREAEFTANFQRLFHNGLALSHPTTDEIVRLADWSAVEQVEDDLLQLGQLLNVSILRPEQQMNYPNNVRILYWIEPNSLGGILRKYPKEGLVIECAVVTRIERFVKVGHDAEALHWADVESALQERRAVAQRWALRYGTPMAYLVGLASPTGWDEESMTRIDSAAENAHLLPYLVDLAELTVHASSANKKSPEYRELFELALGERKVKQIQQQVRELLLATNALRFADLQVEIGCSQGLLHEACVQLAKSNHDYTILQEGSSLVIRNG